MKNILAAAAWRTTVCVAMFSSMLLGRELSAAVLAVQSVSAPAGGSVDVCVALSAGGQPVGGMQANLRWNGGCTVVNMAGGTAAQCRANSATGKNVQTSVGRQPCRNDPNCLTAMLFSISDTSPIPDGQLFCCNFAVLNAPSSARCDINITDAILSQPTGVRVPSVQLENGSIFVTSSGGGGGGGAAGGGAPVAAPPVVSGGSSGGGGSNVPGVVAPAPGGAAPAGRAGGFVPNIVQGIPPAPEQVPGQAPEAAPPGEGAAPSGAAPPPTGAAAAPTAIATPQRTPIPATTPTMKAPAPRPTATAAAKAPTPAPTAGATPKKHKHHKAAAKPTPE